MADAYFSSVVLLLPFDGGSDSTTITDYSGTPKTVSRYGDAKLSTAQYKFGGSSLYLDGTGDYLVAPSSADFGFGTGDFTIDLWYRQAASGTGVLFDFRPNSSTNGYYPMLYVSAGVITYFTNSAVCITSGAVTTNTWYHVALCRSSGVTKLFLDGVQAGSSFTDPISYVTATVAIGSSANGLNYLNGYIDDLRITKGVARYTTTFTPPTALTALDTGTFGYAMTLIPGRGEVLELTYAGFKYGDNTTWSLSCNDDVGITSATEDKGNAFFQPSGAMYLTFGTVNSDTTAQFGDTSLFFPPSAYNILPAGSGDVAAFTNFTLEFWVNVASITPTTIVIWGGATSADPSIYLNGAAFTNRIASSPAISYGVWYHYAVCRKANIIRHYLDGVKFAEALSTGAISITQLGHGLNAGVYLDSIGFSNNYAFYDSADFQPANTPFYNVPSSQGARVQIDYSVVAGEAFGTRITPTEADGQWGKTVLLLRGAGVVGSTAIVDAKGRTIYNQTGVVYSDAQSRNGDTSLYFNGSSAKLVIEPARNLDLIDGDFTIEFWMLPTRIQASAIIDKWGGITKSYTVYLNADGTIGFTFYDILTNSDTTVTGPAVIPSDWSFVSVCRYENDYRVSVNGTGGTVVTTTKTPYRLSDVVYGGAGYGGDTRSWDANIIIGARNDNYSYPTLYYQGFLEDFRITNGFARYQNLALYPTPTAAFLPSGSGSDGDPYWADVALLVHFDEPNGTVAGIRDAKGHVLTVVGAGYVTSNGLYGGAYQRSLALGASLSVGYGSEFDFSTGDFALEMWVTDLVGGMIAGNVYPGTVGWQLSYSGIENPASSRSKGVMQWTQWSSGGIQDIALSVLYPFYGERSRWHHIVVVRKGNDIILYVDGVGSTTTITRRPGYSESRIYLGHQPGSSSAAFNRFDEIRITRVARYAQDFKVPTAPFSETAFSFGDATITEFYGFIPGEVKAAQTVPGAIVPVTYSVSPPLIIGQPSVYGVTLGHANSVLAADPTGGEGFVTGFSVVETITVRQTLSDAQVFYVNDEALAQAVRGIASGLSVVDTASAMLASVGWSDAMSFGMSLPPISQATAPISDAVIFEPRMSAAHGVVVAVSISIASSTDRVWHERMAEIMNMSAPLGASSLVVNAGDSFSTIDTPAFASGATVEVSISLASETSPAWHRDIEEVMTLAMPACFVSQPAAAADTVSLLSETSPAWHRAASSGIGFGSASSPVAILGDTATDGVSLSGAASTSLTLYITMGEDVALGEATAQQLLFQVVMQESVNLSAFFASPAFTTWAMNTRNAAVTQYSGFQFNSFAKMGERYLGANDQGLYWLDGDTDATRSVKSQITTGILQPNGNKLAGVMYAYLGMRGNGQFVVTVTDEAGGSYNYTLDATNMATARVVFGRGFRTRYFTFSLESQGQDFDIDSIEFVTSETARKLQR